MRFSRLWSWLLLLTLSGVLAATGRAAADPAQEAGHPFLRNFPPREYQSQRQVWAGTQDQQGLLYFGTKACVLEYDGVSWRKIPVGTPIDVVHSLATDPGTGTVYVGGTNELGYLRLQPGGTKEFVSLLDQLPADARDGLKEIYGTYATAQGIVFVAVRQVMRWHDGRFQVWKLPGRFRVLSGCADGQVYLQTPERGLLRLVGNDLVPASSDPVFSKSFLMSVAPVPGGAIVVGTFRDGAYTVWPDGRTTALPEGTNALLKTREIRGLLRLPDGALAVGTSYAGVIVLGPDDRCRDHWDEASGLQNNNLLGLFGDREGGVWLCLEAGITQVEPQVPVTIFDPGSGLKREAIQDLARINGRLTLATSAGLYQLRPADPVQARPARWERLPEVDGNFVSLCEFDDTLLASGLPGVGQIGPDGHWNLLYTSATTCEALCRSRVQPDRVFLGTFNGLRSLRYRRQTRRWEEEGEVPGVRGEIRTLAEDARGDLWASSMDEGLFRVVFAPEKPDGTRCAGSATAFRHQPGVLHDQLSVEIRPQGEGVLVGTKNGLYRFNPERGDFSPAAEYRSRYTDGSFRLETIAPDAAGGVWLLGRPARDLWLEQVAGYLAPGQNGRPGTFHPLPHRVSERIDSLGGLVPEADGFVWIAGADGLARLDVRRWLHSSPASPLVTRIRRALAVDDGTAIPRAEPILAASLPYRQNSVKFEYAADTYAIGAGTRYQTRLRGLGAGGWSEPTSRPSVEYGNLWEGAYVFEVRASDGDGRPGRVAAVPFRILPPLPRSPLALCLYVPLLAAGIYGLGRWQSRRLRAQKLRLEGVVASRTADLRRHEHELVRARDDAEAANRAKSQFLANMSHELRTPLNAILGYTQILLKDRELSARNRERLTVVGQSGGHLLTMINEVLDLSKIEAGKLTLEPTDFSLAQVLGEVAAAFRPRLLEKGLEFRFAPGPDLPETVRADVGKLRQVLFNLLSNAVKFTRRGEVTLTVARREDGWVRFAVADTGPGIAERELRSIFLAFHQVGDSALAAQGTGLGLTISQRLVELLGGTLEVASQPGEGSRFWFDLPLATVARPGPSPAACPLDYARVDGYQGERRRLLVVDDEPVNRHVLRGLLEPLGFEIEEAADGQECLERCAQGLPDAVLLDLRMDRLDGFEVARRLRTVPGGRVLRIVAVSASVFDDHRQQAIDAGCDEFLPKPFREDQLLSTLGRLLSLTWTFKPQPAPVLSAAQEPAANVKPPIEEIDAMLELSRRGDILGIKKRLLALHAAGPSQAGHPLVRGLEPLVAGYQMDRIRDVLLRFKENGNC